jgi:hypothetical protein
MPQTTVKRSGRSGSRSSPHKSGSTTGRSRNTSARSNGANPSRASRAPKNSAPSGSQRKSGGPITGLTRYPRRGVGNGRGRAVASKAKDLVASGGKGLGAVGRAASRTKGVAAVGAAGLTGLAGGIALDRWNNSYSRTQAFARSRRGRR